MPPLPPESTKRFFLDYTVCTFQHTLLMRVANSVDEAAASTAFDDFLSALSSDLHALSVDGMRVADELSTISLPATYTGTLSFGSGAGTPADTAGFVDFVGRTSGGIRWRVAVFGATGVATGGNWRATPGEVTAFDNARAVINAATDVWLAIDGNKPVLNNYCDTGYNAYWRNKVR